MGVAIAIAAGLILGSFLSVLIGRWPAWRGVVAGRSHCIGCGHVLAWYELIPVVSWFIQYGRCRGCGIGVSGWYPAYELTMATVLGGYVWRFGGASWLSVGYLAVLALLVFLFFFDLREQVLPDVLTYGLAVLALVMGTHLSMGIAIAAALGALWLISDGRWLGLGDVKLGLGIGLLFGFPDALYVTVGAIWAGALVGVGLMLVGRATRKTALPFGAFWTAVAILFLLR